MKPTFEQQAAAERLSPRALARMAEHPSPYLLRMQGYCVIDVRAPFEGSPCWRWIASGKDDGKPMAYGIAVDKPRRAGSRREPRMQMPARRAMWLEHQPEALTRHDMVIGLCKLGNCVNPAHIGLVRAVAKAQAMDAGLMGEAA